MTSTPAAAETWVLLHGTPLTPAVWDGVAERLDVSGSIRRPALDDAAAEHAQERLAQEILGTVPGRVHVVGHSFGGQVALEMALQAPARVRSLAIVCSRHTPYPAFAATAAALRNGDPVDVRAAMTRWFRPDELAANGPVVRYARDTLESCDHNAWANALDAIASYDRSDEVGRIRMPVRLISAARDVVSPPSVMAELAAAIPGAELYVWPAAAHMSPFNDPDKLVRLIRG